LTCRGTKYPRPITQLLAFSYKLFEIWLDAGEINNNFKLHAIEKRAFLLNFRKVNNKKFYFRSQIKKQKKRKYIDYVE